MTSLPSWDEMSKRWRELYDQQAELARSWVDGQAKLAGTLAAAVPGDRAKAEAEAMAELWRSWLTLGGSLGSMPGMGEPGRIAGETLGRFLDPMSLALVGGSQVGETIRAPDRGATPCRPGRHRAAHGPGHGALARGAAARPRLRGGGRRGVGRGQQALRRRVPGAGPRPAPHRPSPRRRSSSGSTSPTSTLLETHRSEQFLKAQGELLRQGMDFLLAEREMVELLVEPAGLPTRSEIDEVHRSVLDLKRRVRALEKAAKVEPAVAAGGSNAGPQARPSAPTGSESHDPDAHGRMAGPAELMRAAAAFNAKLAAGVEKLGRIKDEDVQIATTPKDEVFRTDKVTLYRYRPLAEQKIRTPILIVYSLVGRYTMTDLQEDRSLIRNLLKQGLDVWVVDWGNSSRADRYLTMDDYVLDYLDDCVEAMQPRRPAPTR